MTQPENGGGKIHAAIIAIMRAVGPIAKDQENKTQNFKYRGVDQVYNACHPLFAEHGVYQTSEILESKFETSVTQKGSTSTRAILKIRFHFRAEDGSSVCTEAMGEGVDYGDKANNKAMSVASKYALLQLLQIPTAMEDPDREPVLPDPGRKEETAGIQPRSSRAVAATISEVIAKWKTTYATGDAAKDRETFAKWASDVCGRVFNPNISAAWTDADVQKAINALQPF